MEIVLREKIVHIVSHTAAKVVARTAKLIQPGRK
jgi:hypothetical protein